MFWAHVVSRMQEFYVLKVRFCALISEILWKMYVTKFSYPRFHGSRCINICDCVNGWASSSATFSASEVAKSCYEYGVPIVLQGLNLPIYHTVYFSCWLLFKSSIFKKLLFKNSPPLLSPYSIHVTDLIAGSIRSTIFGSCTAL